MLPDKLEGRLSGEKAPYDLELAELPSTTAPQDGAQKQSMKARHYDVQIM